MRRRDKSKNIEKVNLLAEQRYLESKTDTLGNPYVSNGEMQAAQEMLRRTQVQLAERAEAGVITEDLESQEVSLKLDNGGVFTGEPRLRPEQLSLQIGRNGHFSFWEGEFSSGGVKIVGGVDPQSEEWLRQATKVYSVAERKSYPEKFAERGGSRKILIKSKDDWTREMTNLKSKGYMYKSQHDINPERDFVSMHNYAKYPYEVIVDDSAKTIHFGEHSISEGKTPFERIGSRDSIAVKESTLTEGGIDPSVVINIIDLAGEWVKGGGMSNVGGETIPTNLASLIMGLMPMAAATAFVANFWSEIKAKLGFGNEVGKPVKEAISEYPNADKIMEKVIDDIYQTVKSTGSRHVEISDQTWQMVEILHGLGDGAISEVGAGYNGTNPFMEGDAPQKNYNSSGIPRVDGNASKDR